VEPSQKKDCFVISPIGLDDSDTRKRADQVLRHIIKKALWDKLTGKSSFWDAREFGSLKDLLGTATAAAQKERPAETKTGEIEPVPSRPVVTGETEAIPSRPVATPKDEK